MAEQTEQSSVHADQVRPRQQSRLLIHHCCLPAEMVHAQVNMILVSIKMKDPSDTERGTEIVPLHPSPPHLRACHCDR